MELKLVQFGMRFPLPCLLIVPYGIETTYPSSLAILASLLIVPYGIETYNKEYICSKRINLLIVPYGIETMLRRNFDLTLQILILRNTSTNSQNLLFTINEGFHLQWIF